NALRIALAVWFVGIGLAIVLRRWKVPRGMGQRSAIAALAIVAVYWGVLAIAHRAAFANTLAIANKVAASRGEYVMRVAAMPTAATPFRWQSVAETDRAIYRYVVTTGEASAAGNFVRYGKPTG